MLLALNLVTPQLFNPDLTWNFQQRKLLFLQNVAFYQSGEAYQQFLEY